MNKYKWGWRGRTGRAWIIIMPDITVDEENRILASFGEAVAAVCQREVLWSADARLLSDPAVAAWRPPARMNG